MASWLSEQTLIFTILAATIGLFLWGRWRHDVVALASLLACVFTGLVPVETAFVSLGHPAVITVACVLVLSAGLQATGAVDVLAQRLLPKSAGLLPSLAALVGLGAVLSAFMNNVGAMALLMPVAVQLASRNEIPPGRVLMPLAFGTILGGMTTLIGTPPNLIVSGFRAEVGGGSFGMFDFSPVGLVVAAAGVTFTVLLGWRLVPVRQQAAGNSFDTGTYFTEVRISADSKVLDKTLREVEADLDQADAQVVGLVRNQFRVSAPNPARRLREGDILVIEADPEAISGVLSGLGLKLAEDVQVEDGEAEEGEVEEGEVEEGEVEEGEVEEGEVEDGEVEEGEVEDGEVEDGEVEDGEVEDGEVEDGEDTGSTADRETEDAAEEQQKTHPDEIELLELVVMPHSALVGRSVSDIQLRSRFSLNLLAISRHGRRSIKRLRTAALRAGDVLLMQGSQEALSGFSSVFACVPLAKRSISLPDKGRATLAGGVMLLAICGAALGLVPAAISFATGVLVFMLLRIVPPRKVYEAIDWPVIILLGALIPVAGAMASTGAADLLARSLLDKLAQGHPVVALAVILIVTMSLSDFMNNAATAAVMCPIAISTAAQLGLNADSFLMAVAIGASCAFLTPIGHQNNTLILGPGGFRFGDYWRFGLPMELLVVAVSLPMLLWIWPL